MSRRRVTTLSALLAAVLCTTTAPFSQAAPTRNVPIANHSFDQDAITGTYAPAFEVRVAPPAGWDDAGGGGQRGLLAPDAPGAERFYPGVTSGLHGDKVDYHHGGPSRITQVTNERLAPHTRYALTLGTGTRTTTEQFAGYDIRLETESGKPVGSWTGVNTNPAAPGTFTDVTRSFVTGPAPVGRGERLRITLGQVGSVFGYADLDDVRLTATRVRPRAHGQPIDVVVVAGQSNAHGWASDTAKLSEANRHYATAPNPHALLGYRQRNLPEPADNIGSMGQLAPQGAGFVSHFSGFGPELSLGTDLADRRGRVAVIKYAVGSSGLARNYLKQSPYGAPLYGDFLTQLTTGLDQLRQQGFAPRLRTVYWLLGETDSGDGTAAAYGANMTKLMADLRTDLDAPRLSAVLTQINPNMPALVGRPGVAQVNEAMAAMAAADPARVRYVRTDDIRDGFADIIHYSADQSVLIGQRWATALR
ncbi:sialate O-acetylesterase [Lentzea sp. JNUCC 0626]|uniref:sialate O-acetylesterase n=1 Tax=Lentzea sp. JNUCC 0626 TaxID=3367513 RepID=UPI003748B324